MAELHITMTRREYQAVKMIARGLTYKEVGDELGILEGTVNAHLQSCRRRFHCKTLTHLFYRLGLAAGHDLPVRFVRDEECDGG